MKQPNSFCLVLSGHYETIKDSSTIPTVPKRKIKAIEKQLKDVEVDIDRTKEKVTEDLENLVDGGGL